jgi:Tfp pilus assembly protein PilV
VRAGAQRGAMAGVGLIEVLIALLIIGGGVLALSRMQGLLLIGAPASRQQAEASFLAQQEIEERRSRDFATLAPASTRTVTGTTAEYTVQTNIVTTGIAGQMQFGTVEVIVTWTDAQGQARAYTAATRLQPIGAPFSALLY